MARSFLDLLYDEAPREEFDRAVAGAGDDPEARRRYDVALRLRDLIARQRSREAELSALYETASDLTAIRDVNAILAAIVRRARQLLQADMTYLSLNDEVEGASFMKVTDGALSTQFRTLRLPLGTGLLGLVAQTGAPYFTSDYQNDDRFVHRGFVDDAVADEGIRAILGVPLVLEGRVIGALMATHRTVRPFPPEEVSLLTSFAAHAAVALENARLFAELDEANALLREQTEAVEQAAVAHDQLTGLLLHRSTLAEVVAVLTELLGGGAVAVLDTDGSVLAGDAGPAPATWRDAVPEAVSSGRSVPVGDGHLAPALAGQEHLATVVVHGGPPLDLAGRRTLERGAIVAGLVLLFARSVDEAEERLGGALLTDLLEGSDADPARMRQRARGQRLRLDAGCVVAVVDVPAGERHRAARAAARAARAVDGLAVEHRGRPVLVVPGSGGGAREVGERLRATLAEACGTPVTVGVAPVPQDPVDGGLPAAYDEARRCVDTLLVLGRAGESADPAALGVTRLLLGGAGPAELADFVERTLGPVLAYDAQRGSDLVGTLEAWFAEGGGARASAARLHVHPNTVAQRLERVGDLLGAEWRRPEAALDLQLALRVVRLQRGVPTDH
ncbi:Purine catabolism regulatory protein [Nocardioides dokdonensis FR1436]|uniref:Purine catabolism regulatory protein n=1 Tax=Nocardioides dokdonensis FR1436 TaxID=1300347 RepID=A0A1A9GLR9_9ACTN|nr:GAF domain-containing protein [Nocardioides dokdonensis]ANH39218.1 Purine catabolism regulatory protein [Nocardioides dokdonensis FR1436]